jgi:hypothetical protein
VQSATTRLPGLARAIENSHLREQTRFLGEPGISVLIFEAWMSGHADMVRWMVCSFGPGRRRAERASTPW